MYKDKEIEKLRESEALLVEAQRLAQIGSWAVDVKTQTVTWSDELFRIFGYEPGEIVPSYKAFLEIVHPDDRAFVLADNKRMESERISLRHEHRILRADGTIRYIDANGAVACDEAGNIVKINGTVQDVTRRRLAEEKLRENEERLRAIFDTSRDGVIVEADGIIVYANKAEAILFGYDEPEELFGKNISDLIQPSDRELMTEYGAARLNGEARPTIYEFRGKRKDGSPVELEAAVSIVSISTVAGKKYITTTTRDITERKKAEREINISEQRYRALITSSVQVVWLADAEGRAVLANPKWTELTGQSFEEMRGTGWLDALHPESREQSRRLSRQAIENKAIYEDEQTVRTRDGSYRIFFSRGVPIFNDNGEILEWIGTLTDITERKRAEQSLTQSEKDYRALFEQAHDAIIVFKPEHEIVLDVNERACQIYGFTRDEFIGMSLETISKNQIQGEDKVRETLEAGKNLAFETVQKRKDGSEMYLEINASTVDFQGQQAIISINRDVTERKQAEEKLQESEERFRSFMNNNPAIAFMKDEAGRYVFCNDTMEQVFSIKVGNLLGKTDLEWLPENVANEVRSNDEKILASNQPAQVIESVPTPDGEVHRWLSIKFPVSDASGKKFLGGVAIDVTERERAEEEILASQEIIRASREELSLILNNIDEIVYRGDITDDLMRPQLKMINSHVEKLIGCHAEELLINPGIWLESIDPDQISFVAGQVKHLIEHAEPVSIEYRMKHCLTGDYNWVEDRIIPEIDENGRVKGFFGSARDITQRKISEARVHDSEAKFRSITETANDAIIVSDSGGNITFWNKGAQTVFGYTEEEAVSLPMIQIMPEVYREAHSKGIERLRAGGEPHLIGKTLELHGLRKDGSEFPLELSLSTYKTGGETFYSGIIRDTTERKQAEEALRRSEANLAAAQRITHLGSWELDILDLEDASKNPVHCSDEVYRIFGYEPGQIEITGEVFYSFVRSPERTRISEALFETVKQQTDLNIEFSIVLPDGKESIVHLQAEKIYDEQSNKPSKLIGTVQDITDRKLAREALEKSERQYRFLSEGIMHQVWTAQPDGKLDYVNNRTLEYFGLPFEQRIKEGWQPVVHPDDVAGCVKRWTKSLETGEDYEVEFRLKKADGSYHWHSGRATAGRDSDGKIVKWFGTNTDINDKKLAEEELKLSVEHLQQSQKMEAIGTLTGGVAHDFNNLLTAILGNTQLAQRKLPPNDPIQLRLTEVADAGNRAAELTQKLLAFSRRQQLERRTVNLNHTIGKIVTLIERIIGEDVEMSVKYASDLSAVFADPGQLEQVIMNLAVNARDAMPSGGKLTIETSNVELDESYCRLYPSVIPGRYVQIRVSDSGTGIDEETQARIFEPYFTTKEVDKGTGLGLSMAYGIIQQHAGHINLYSELGFGTTFKIYLPIDKKTVEEKVQAIPPSFLGGAETILVAEDEEMLRNLAKESLEELGYTVLLAKNGEEAVEVFGANRERIDLFLSDVIMPRMGGSEAYEQIRESGGNVPLIFMTGYSSETVQSRFVKPKKTAEELGATVIQKPYSLDELGRIVREVLDKNHKP